MYLLLRIPQKNTFMAVIKSIKHILIVYFSVVAGSYYVNIYSSHSPRRTEHSGEKWTADNKKVPAYKQASVDGIPNGA